MIIKIEDYYGNTMGAFHVYENDENGEFAVKNCIEDKVNIADIVFDDIFDTNDEMIRIQISEKPEKIWRTSNYYNVGDVPNECKNLIKELNSYSVVLKWYRRKNYSDCFIIIENYFGHIDYGKEFGYFKTHNDICKILLKNLLYSLNDNTDYEDTTQKESFINFCNRMMNKIIYNLEKKHGFKVNKDELAKRCF